MRSYPEYSADFFDGQHYVMKGASPATAIELTRPSFRNWFRGNYPYVYAKFRTAQQLTFAATSRRDLALTPKQLQSKYLYDALGSSLFEAICRLPWYRITRAEQRLLERHAAQIVATDLSRTPTTAPLIVELGCGSGEKIVILAEALQASGRRGRVHLIDISPQALEQSERTLGRLRHISVVGHRDTYEVGLRSAARARATSDNPMLVLLLGSNIGNFDEPAAHDFLRAIRGALAPGDSLLLGADLVKPERDLQLAYDDPLGVTAAFNRNLLVRINRELGGTFDLDGFATSPCGTRQHHRVEMHLESLAADSASSSADAAIDFARGERDLDREFLQVRAGEDRRDGTCGRVRDRRAVDR